MVIAMKHKKIILEPLLEKHAGDLDASQCAALAAVYERWARELRVKMVMLLKDQQPPKPREMKIPRGALWWWRN
jgi:hypothetical protein